MVTVNAHMLRQLGGTSCVLAGKSVRFLGESGRAKVTAGGEGYVIPAIVEGDGAKIVLKVYRKPSPERHERIRFLAELDLGGYLESFWPAPRAAVMGAVMIPAGPSGAPEELMLEGLICPFVEGECYSALLATGYDPPLFVRVRLASQLVNAVSALETCKMAHGDLSASNIMVANAGSADARLFLIDYDGFCHDGVPAIPIAAGSETGGRGWGSDGYRSPHLPVGSDTVVKTDRVALAALTCELLMARPQDFHRLGRDTLIDQRAVDAGAPPSLPPDIEARWLQGASLVERAFRETDPRNAPSPAEWLCELQRIAVLGGPTQVPYALRVRENAQPTRRVMLFSAQGALAPVSPTLAGLHYSRATGEMLLQGTLGKPMSQIGVTGRLTRHPIGALAIKVDIGDRLRISDTEIQVE